LDKIIYANPIKANETLQDLNQYKPLVTYDNYEEIKKIKKYAPLAGLALRIKVPNTGAMVELSSKFGASPGEAVDMILAADKAGLLVEGLSFHVGSQTTNFQNYVAAINLAANLFKEARDRGYTKMNLLDIGGGFPAPYDDSVKPFRELASLINRELDRLFPKNIQILAEPGRFLVATAAVAVSKIIGKAVRDGKLCYYINDGFITPSRESSSTTATTTSSPSSAGRRESAPSSAPPATPLMWSPWPSNCRAASSSATCSTARTSAPTAMPPRPGSTALRRPRSCT